MVIAVFWFDFIRAYNALIFTLSRSFISPRLDYFCEDSPSLSDNLMLLNESLFIVLCFIVSVDLSGPFREVAHQSEHQHISQISTMSEAMWIIPFCTEHVCPCI